MVLQEIARGARHLSNAYKTKPGLKAIANTIGIYGGTKLIGALGTVVTGNRDIDEIADMVAPVLSGAYALNESKKIKNGGLKNITQILLAGAIGGDLAGEIYNYHGANDTLRGIRDIYTNAYVKVANTINCHSPSKVGFGIGVVCGTLAKIVQYYQKEK